MRRAPTVPAGHRPVRGQHVDGVVLHALDQQTEALLAAPQLILLPPALRQIARDLREGEQLAAFVAQRGDHDVRPEPRAVLAQAPAFVLETPIHGRALQLELRPFALDIRRRIENREVLADDFMRLVLLRARSAGVPAHDVAARIEHEDGVVLHAFSHQPKEFRIERGRGFLHTSGSLSLFKLQAKNGALHSAPIAAVRKSKYLSRGGYGRSPSRWASASIDRSPPRAPPAGHPHGLTRSSPLCACGSDPDRCATGARRRVHRVQATPSQETRCPGALDERARRPSRRPELHAPHGRRA